MTARRSKSAPAPRLSRMSSVALSFCQFTRRRPCGEENEIGVSVCSERGVMSAERACVYLVGLQ